MSMKSFLSSIIERNGVEFVVTRNGRSHIEKGAKNTLDGVACFCFDDSADIKPGDTLENPERNQYFVSDVETMFDAGKPAFLKVTYKTAAQIQQENKSNTVFNIQNAYGSIIGNNNQCTANYYAAIDDLKARVSSDNSTDKEDMEKIISLLEAIVSDKVKPSKGLFSKFSEVMERHSWLSSSVAGTILSWLLTQIPLR